MTCRCLVASLAMAAVQAMGSTSYAAIIDFESIPPGTVYGEESGDLPGIIVLSQDGITMALEEFFLGSFVGFNKAEVDGPYDDWFETTSLQLDNISVAFDFSGVGFDVTRVTLEFQEFGGSSNLSLDGFSLFELVSIRNPLEVAPNVFASIDEGLITLVGDIVSFQIGGQELAIDNLVAVPEPTTALLLGLGGVWLQRRPWRGQTNEIVP